MQEVVIRSSLEVVTGVSVMVLNLGASHRWPLPSPPLNTKKRARQRCLDQDQTLRATTPALDEIPSNRTLASRHHCVKHLVIFVHIMQIDLRMVGISDI